MPDAHVLAFGDQTASIERRSDAGARVVKVTSADVEALVRLAVGADVHRLEVLHDTLDECTAPGIERAARRQILRGDADAREQREEHPERPEYQTVAAFEAPEHETERDHGQPGGGKPQRPKAGVTDVE